MENFAIIFINRIIINIMGKSNNKSRIIKRHAT